MHNDRNQYQRKWAYWKRCAELHTPVSTAALRALTGLQTESWCQNLTPETVRLR